jgi:hypothetical protein
MSHLNRLLLALFFFSSMLLGESIIGPIGLSGSGTYSWAVNQGNQFMFSANGTNGIDTVTMTSIDRLPDGLPYSGLPDFIDGNVEFLVACAYGGTINIDGFSSGPCVSNWTLGGGLTMISLFTAFPVGPSPASALVSAYLIWGTPVEDFIFDGHMLVTVTDTFTIVPTPEPAPAVLSCLALITMGFAARRLGNGWQNRLR